MTFEELHQAPNGTKFYAPGIECEKTGNDSDTVTFEVINGAWEGILSEVEGRLNVHVVFTGTDTGIKAISKEPMFK